MENVFIDIASKKINKLFFQTNVSLDALLEKLEDLMIENDTLTEKIEDLEEEIREIKGAITEQSIVEIFTPKPKEKQIKFTGKISKDTLKKYKEKFNSNDEFDELVNKLLEKYFNESEVNSL